MATIVFEGEVKASNYMEGLSDGQVVFVPVEGQSDGSHKVFFMRAEDILNYEEIKDQIGIVQIVSNINTDVDYKQPGIGFDQVKIYAALADEIDPAYTHTPGGHTQYFT